MLQWGVCGCLEDSDCDSNVCESNECVECRADTQCESNAAEPFCAEFSCVECTTDDHCPSMLGGDENYCESYRCVECREDAQCADGLSCVSNVCVERARNVTCAAPNNYEIGQVILGTLRVTLVATKVPALGSAATTDPKLFSSWSRRLQRPRALASKTLTLTP